MKDLPKVGEHARDFSCTDHDGREVCLSDYWKDGSVLLYFYPKDQTETCTKQACDFQSQLKRFNELKCTVLGISPDTPDSHRRFRAAEGLKFTLLCDPEHSIAERWGVWREKTLYGRTYMGVVRSSFVIDRTGIIVAVFDAVRLKGHIDAVLHSVATLATTKSPISDRMQVSGSKTKVRA